MGRFKLFTGDNLSVKKYLQDSERRETREYMKKMADNDNAFSFGSIFKDKLGKQD